MLTNRGTDGRLRPEIRTLRAAPAGGPWAVDPPQQIPTTAGLRTCLVSEKAAVPDASPGPRDLVSATRENRG